MWHPQNIGKNGNASNVWGMSNQEIETEVLISCSVIILDTVSKASDSKMDRLQLLFV